MGRRLEWRGPGWWPCCSHAPAAQRMRCAACGGWRMGANLGAFKWVSLHQSSSPAARTETRSTPKTNKTDTAKPITTTTTPETTTAMAKQQGRRKPSSSAPGGIAHTAAKSWFGVEGEPTPAQVCRGAGTPRARASHRKCSPWAGASPNGQRQGEERPAGAGITGRKAGDHQKEGAGPRSGKDPAAVLAI